MTSTRPDKRVDVAIAGGGHNGLVAAFYLARAGLSVHLVEARPVLGGAAVTQEFHPGFRNSLASYTVSLLHPRVIRDMDLPRHGLTIRERPQDNMLLSPDGGVLHVPSDRAAFQREVAKICPDDAATLPAYDAWLTEAADVLRALALAPPPDTGGDLLAMLRAGRLARQLWTLPPRTQSALLQLFTASAAEVLDQWFRHDRVKALFAFDSVVGSFTTPEAPGSAYVLLHHCFGEVNGKRGAWGHAMGGMGAITQAMARAAGEAGAVLETGAPVARIRVQKGRADGLELTDGRTIQARHVLAALGPKPLFTRLMDEKDVPGDFLAAMRRFKTESASLRINLALDRLPDFTAAKGPGPHLTGGIIVGGGMDYLHNAHESARRHGWSKAPVVEMLIPSTLDPSLAPEGKHVASLFCQHFRYDLPEGHWDDFRDQAADHAIDTVAAHAPELRDSILARQVLSPLDLERTLGLAGGDIFHGALTLNQLFAARPALGAARYRMPVAGLYLGASGAHPGGGVSGLPGHNAAHALLQDRRLLPF
ncbi:phytoene desaturase family protein [Yunchengibacter salinarum]|uniref:phytoene desaturase family protein n=1 Tax=Yunchengibacter salinarum TaxID=3133399 RepID=UPI0035B69305